MKLDFTYGEIKRVLDLSRITIRETIEMKQLIGMAPAEWNAALNNGDGEAAGYAWYWACQRAGDEPDWVDLMDDLNLIDLNFEVVLDPAPAAPKTGAGPTRPPTSADPMSPTKSSSGGPASPDTSAIETSSESST